MGPAWLFGLLLSAATAAPPAPALFIITSQAGAHHDRLAGQARDSLLDQWTALVPPTTMRAPRVLLSSEMDSEVAAAAWTVFPLLEVMALQMAAEEALEWVALLQENTELDLARLTAAAGQHNFQPREEELFLGRGLQDSQHTIIHHFAPPGLLFPDLEAGLFLSRKLVENLWHRLQEDESKLPDFNIDAAYEFAKFIHDEGNGVTLQNMPEICGKKSSRNDCVSYARQDGYSCLAGSQVNNLREALEDLQVAVKTCTAFHSSRLPVVQSTWGPHFPNIQYVSDSEDSEFGTTVLPFTGSRRWLKEII